MEEVKEEEEKLNINKQAYLKEFKRMREELVVLQGQAQEAQNYG